VHTLIVKVRRDFLLSLQRIRRHLCCFGEGAEAGLNGVQMSVRRPDAFAVAGNSACPVQVSPYRCNSFFCGHGLEAVFLLMAWEVGVFLPPDLWLLCTKGEGCRAPPMRGMYSYHARNHRMTSFLDIALQGCARRPPTRRSSPVGVTRAQLCRLRRIPRCTAHVHFRRGSGIALQRSRWD
jgi:hypothetical protein